MRPSIDQTCLETAELWSKRGTCIRRKVGCVLTDASGIILSTGYNGVAKKLEHCLTNPCIGAFDPAGSKTSMYSCEAIHAEQNALLQCKDVQKIHTCYVTCSPCIQCTKLLLQTSCQYIKFMEPSSHNDEAKAIWAKRHPASSWIQYEWVAKVITEVLPF